MKNEGNNCSFLLKSLERVNSTEREEKLKTNKIYYYKLLGCVCTKKMIIIIIGSNLVCNLT